MAELINTNLWESLILCVCPTRTLHHYVGLCPLQQRPTPLLFSFPISNCICILLEFKAIHFSETIYKLNEYKKYFESPLLEDMKYINEIYLLTLSNIYFRNSVVQQGIGLVWQKMHNESFHSQLRLRLCAILKSKHEKDPW